MKTKIKSLARWLSKWAWRQEIETCENIATLRGMSADMDTGKMELRIQQDPAIAQWVCACFAEMIAKSPNYTEMQFTLDSTRGKFERMFVLIQKHNGKSPHQLRQQAQADREELRECLRKVAGYFEMVDSMQPDRKHGKIGDEVRLAIREALKVDAT